MVEVETRILGRKIGEISNNRYPGTASRIRAESLGTFLRQTDDSLEPVLVDKSEVFGKPLVTYNAAKNTVDKTPGHFAIGIAIPGTNGKVFQAPGDTNEEGHVEEILGPDGTMIKIRKHNVPWGGYWEVIG